MNKFQDKIAIASVVVGANVGGYMFAKDDPNGWAGVSSWAIGSLIGGGAGIFLGYTAPFVIPALSVAVPGYALASYHSSLQASQQKVGTPEAQKGRGCQTKEAKHE
jgi:hypothetical protein